MHETEKLDSFAIDFAFQGFWLIRIRQKNHYATLFVHWIE